MVAIATYDYGALEMESLKRDVVKYKICINFKDLA